MSLRTNEPSLSAGELTDLVDSVTGDRSFRLLIGSAFASRGCAGHSDCQPARLSDQYEPDRAC